MAGANHVLVVDNDPEICDVVRICLEDAGYRVSTAVNHESAEQLLVTGEIDFALIDIMLSDGPTGFELARTARVRRIPCLLMTGHPMLMEPLNDARRRRILRKPFRLAELVQRVKAGLRRRNRRRDQSPA